MSQEYTEQRVRFGRMERRGVFLGLSYLQLGVLGGITLFVLLLLILKLYGVLLVSVPLLLVVAVLGAGRWNREPVLVLALNVFSFTRRIRNGQSVAVGGPDAVGAVTRVGQLNLAGGLGSVQLHEVEGGGAFTYDTSRRRFTLTLSCSAPAWALEDVPDQLSAMGGFVRFLNGLTRVPGLAGVDIQARADASASTAIKDYLDEQVALREKTAYAAVPCPSCGVVNTTRFCVACGTSLRDIVADKPVLSWVDEQARIAAAELSAAAQEFSYYITFAFQMGVLKDRRLAQRIKRGGGGLPGIASVVSLEVKSLTRALATAGVSDVAWLDAAALTALMRLAYDPETAIARQRSGSASRRQNAEMVRPMAQEEHFDYVRIDETFHQTFWVADWPTSDVPVGFLEELITDGGEYTRVVTLQMVPVSKAKALKRIQQAQTDLDAAATTRGKLGQRDTREQTAEADDVTEREEDLSEGYRDLEFRGFVTVSAASRDELDDARNGIEVAAQEAQIEVRPMYFQQAAAFNTAALPLGLGTVKK